ncbi:hypothetical protein [Neisseria dentiae]|uniref:hypothetical protein n=1 Tax=Neisseria dentiae TaxID=194197 RepID=UPI0035A0A5BB
MGLQAKSEKCKQRWNFLHLRPLQNSLRPSETSSYRHSRVGGNPDGSIELLIKQILECQASGFPPRGNDGNQVFQVVLNFAKASAYQSRSGRLKTVLPQNLKNSHIRAYLGLNPNMPALRLISGIKF